MDEFQKFGIWVLAIAIVIFVTGAYLWGIWSGEPEQQREEQQQMKQQQEPQSTLNRRCTHAFMELQAGVHVSILNLLTVRESCSGYRRDAIDLEIAHLQAVLEEKDRLMRGIAFDRHIQPRLFRA